MSRTTDLARLSATELAPRIRETEVTAIESVEAALERIDDQDDEINAFVTVCAERAREAAADADRALESGDDIGPLHGVPVALKDLGALKAGVRNTFGSTLFADYVAPETSVVVERLEDAGAIVIGKTNTPAFGHKGTTTNELVGATASPIDPDLNAGGSSGGSAAAVAAGTVPIATGSDAGGSVRIPASACGVYGFKPTFGLVPGGGRPHTVGRDAHHITKGPIARTVEDAAVLLSVMAGPHPSDPASVPVEIDYRGAVGRSIEDYRIAYSPDLEAFPVEDEVRAVIEEALEAFEDAGATVKRTSVDHGYSMADLTDAVASTYATAMLESATLIEETQGIDPRDHPDEVADSLLAMIDAGEARGTEDVARSSLVRTGVFEAVQDVLGEYDLLVTPTLSRVDVGLHEDLAADAWEWPLTWPFNWTGHPAASAPAGLTDRGHPVGIQLVGRRFEDDAVLAASGALERERPWSHLYE